MTKSFWWFLAIGLAAMVVLSTTMVRAECLSQRAARSANPDSHLSYSGRVEGHKGAHCWYAGDARAARSNPRAAAQSRPPRRLPSGSPGRTVGSIPATGATSYAEDSNDRSNSSVPTVVAISPHNLDDAVGRKQTSKRLANRTRQPITLAGVDSRDAVVGIAADEYCAVDCVRSKSHEMVPLPIELDHWISSVIASEPIASFAYRFDAAYQ
jgi:hypothetical protein